MYEETVEARLRNLMNDLEGQMRSCLKSCQSPQERLLLLEFMRLPGAQITAPSHDPAARKPRASVHGTSINLTKAGTTPENDMHEATSAAGLTWLEWWAHSKVFDNEATSQCCRLIPKFRVQDSESGENGCWVDFALFWPRANGQGYHRIAITCSGEEKQTPKIKEHDKYSLLQKQGWIVIRLPETEILDNPSRIVQRIRDVATEENVRSMRERRSGH
ncbi:MAG: hypothetical protein HY912_18500 [Desulfomonile tiedjei]|uniref:DUF559 domain-containing protein n=1 Tax=Desulfomonile tiedjei TaxID=2358 RepID=A0A9D6V5Y5_9BACT|nr:hypothetical protein [Desulfomonile tiedjei]